MRERKQSQSNRFCIARDLVCSRRNLFREADVLRQACGHGTEYFPGYLLSRSSALVAVELRGQCISWFDKLKCRRLSVKGFNQVRE